MGPAANTAFAEVFTKLREVRPPFLLLKGQTRGTTGWKTWGRYSKLSERTGWRTSTNWSGGPDTWRRLLRSYTANGLYPSGQWWKSRRSGEDRAYGYSALLGLVLSLDKNKAQVDIFGGWLDTPPITYETSPSAVINLAVSVDGQVLLLLVPILPFSCPYPARSPCRLLRG